MNSVAMVYTNQLTLNCAGMIVVQACVNMFTIQFAMSYTAMA